MTKSESNVVFAEPYEVLACGYDIVMSHVDYEEWASYMHSLIVRYAKEAQRILELGCGTGLLAIELQPLADYDYVGLDLSVNMIETATAFAEENRMPLDFHVADFRAFEVEQPFDVAILLQDGINYLLDPKDVVAALSAAADALIPGGLFIFDQSTPANSINNAEFFNDEEEFEGFAYVRTSRYDPEERLHHTQFEITLDGNRYIEQHVQKAHTRVEMGQWIARGPFEIVAAFDGLSTRPATDETERIHWVLRKSE